MRKIGAPGNPEYGLGTVIEGGFVELDEARALESGYRREELAAAIESERVEAEGRAALYRSAHPRIPLAGRHVVLVDDGAATGGTIVAAAHRLRNEGAARITIAVGVAPPATVARFRAVAERVEVVLVPDPFFAVGEFYSAFEAVGDDEVISILERAARFRGTSPSS